jgi:hypothetical protein
MFNRKELTVAFIIVVIVGISMNLIYRSEPERVPICAVVNNDVDVRIGTMLTKGSFIYHKYKLVPNSMYAIYVSESGRLDGSCKLIYYVAPRRTNEFGELNVVDKFTAAEKFIGRMLIVKGVTDPTEIYSGFIGYANPETIK